MEHSEAGAASISIIEQTAGTIPLPVLIDRAATALAEAKTAAEVLEARDMASVVYDIAKKAARLGKAKQAHDELIMAAHRAQADALVIEAKAKQRLADEYDAAQKRGEVARLGTNQKELGLPEQKTRPATVDEIGLTHKQVHEARVIRDAEKAEPGIVRRTVDEAIANGEEPTKAKVRGIVAAVVSGVNPVEPTSSERLARTSPSEKEKRRVFKERPVLKEAGDLLWTFREAAYCMNYDGYSLEDLPERARLTPATFWEYMTFVGEDDADEYAQSMEQLIKTLKAILKAKPKQALCAEREKLASAAEVDASAMH
jgi:hypothetical protein